MNSSNVDTTNPKDLLGIKKVPMGAVPPVAIAHEACAFYDGELKYGYRNWRDKKVRARVYVDACKRHLDDWLEGHETAEDSGIHNLGHARACLGIVLDAQESGCLIDDRVPGPFRKVMDRLSVWVAKRNAEHNKTVGTTTVGDWPPRLVGRQQRPQSPPNWRSSLPLTNAVSGTVLTGTPVPGNAAVGATLYEDANQQSREAVAEPNYECTLSNYIPSGPL